MALNRSDKSRILRRYFPGMTRNSEMSTEPSSKSEISDATVWGSSSIRGVIALFGDSSLGAGVGSDVAFAPCELGGNGVVAALGTVVSVGVACGVSACSGAGVTGLGADVAPSTEAGTVGHRLSWRRAWTPQASRAATITRVVHRDILKIQKPFLPVPSSGTAKSVLPNLPVQRPGFNLLLSVWQASG